jgi:homoserine O-succinyltransferase/O-acetyltransferase
MPITVPDDLPAISTLESENIFVMNEHRATHQDIRPLNILFMNLMPTKVETETQIMRLLSNSPLQVDIDLLQAASHESKNTSKEYLERFYTTFDEVKSRKYDGLIITGAPVETIPFEEVDYWGELCEIMEWSKTNVCSTMHICWGAQAGLYYHYGIPKYQLATKISGIFPHRQCEENEPLLRGFDDIFNMPHSRNTEVRASDIKMNPHLHILASSNEVGVAIVASESRQIFVIGHLEYDKGTLASEYDRDTDRGMNPHVPTHYFPNDDPRMEPNMMWRSHANLLFMNWLNYYVYQQTPFDINMIGRE